MAAASYKLYNTAKRYLNNATINLTSATIKDFLCKSTSNASTFTLSTIGSVTNKVSGGGYKGAIALAGKALTTGASAKEIKWTANNSVFSASGGTISSIFYSVIAVSGGKLICWAALSTAAFNVTSGNTLTNQYNSSGIFKID